VVQIPPLQPFKAACSAEQAVLLFLEITKNLQVDVYLMFKWTRDYFK
jgi:hypothetical protein